MRALLVLLVSRSASGHPAVACRTTRAEGGGTRRAGDRLDDHAGPPDDPAVGLGEGEAAGQDAAGHRG